MPLPMWMLRRKWRLLAGVKTALKFFRRPGVGPWNCSVEKEISYTLQRPLAGPEFDSEYAGPI